ncbi:YdiU family protein [Rufibacter sediminis]|uniref:Protein nucleotidyltransferase YdiU n=1 Tax=Rufibacter sediminis TaxID=2762756 RepID=A0ABR6VXI2_9BACT|nr:YdiU family protein [Rufibacter sediminis]MBC3541876.1 YdiU family protein [Rufibacter sediminis]
MQSLSTKEYKNEFVTAFDGDDSGNLKPRQTPGVLYSKAVPTPVKKPELLAWSEELAQQLGIEKPTDQKDVDVLGGNHVAPSMYPYAACYAGHQFGNWAGQLGDGRAITLGEWQAPDGNSWELQLKGAGMTPYSRRADGRAVLRSSVREYLMSEAMHYLGVPTTRALSLVSTGDQVMRDMFYNGNPAFEPGAIVMRVAPSFLRFGSFEMPAARQEKENLQKLVDWTISRYYLHIQGENRILEWFKEILERTAALMVEWMRVGFVHGVMNTDNMSILGLTIDYGPFSFLDDYDPDFTPNTTDLPGRRYAFGKQASIGYWNLGCLASAIAPLLPGTEELVAVLETYSDSFHEKYYAMMANKLGLEAVQEGDQELITRFTDALYTLNLDLTIFFQQLMELPQEPGTEAEVIALFQDSFYRELGKEEQTTLFTLLQDYATRLNANTGSREETLARMQKANPRIILRNYLLHQAIEELERGENTLFQKLQAAMKDPYSRHFDEFFAKRPDWASQKAGCSMLSCSS